MSLTPAEPAIFRGVVALELRDGAPPRHPALAAAAAGELVSMLGRDLAALVPGVRDCDLALLAAHFDPAEALRPGWPLHRRASELLQRAPGQAQGARMVGFGADAAGEVPLPLQCEPELQGGGLRILPFVLHGNAARDVGDALEVLLLDRGMAAADTALALQDGLGAQVEHAQALGAEGSGWQLRRSAGLRHARLSENAFTETGAAPANLSVRQVVPAVLSAGSLR